MYLPKIIKNSTNADIDIIESGQTILANDQLVIDPLMYYIWAKPELAAEISANVFAGSLIINNGLIDLSPADGLRFLQHPERILIQKDGSDVTQVGTVINFEGSDITVTNEGDGKATVRVGALAPFTDTLYWANCICGGNMFSDFEPLVDYTYSAIKVEDC